MGNNIRVLITGGTGSFGNYMAGKLLDNPDIEQIIVFSRDEKKQAEMRHKYKHNEKLKFIIGDIRNFDSIYHALKGVTHVFGAAALKHVPICEKNTWEAVQTNIIGNKNLLQACVDRGVKNVVMLSTDKAVMPINVMGMTKAIMEKLALEYAEKYPETRINIVRYGNILFSRGSVVPIFIQSILNNEPIKITDPNMRRFILSLSDAIWLVEQAMFNSNESGCIFVKHSPAIKIIKLAEALYKYFYENTQNLNFTIIHNRGGEKLDETLITKEEMAYTQFYDTHYIIRPFLLPDYNKFSTEYTSENTYQLSIEDAIRLFDTIPEIRNIKKAFITNNLGEAYETT